MSSLVFHVDADKIDTNLLDSIKAFFGKQKIHISVDSDSKLSEIIDQGNKSKECYEVPYDVISHLANALEADEAIDVVSEIEKYKMVK